MTLAPRHPRVLHPGPRVRIAEITLVGHVVLIFAALFGSWIMLQNSNVVGATAATGAAMTLVVRDVLRLRQIRKLRRLALHGMITQSRVTSARLTRFCCALRADGAVPGHGVPLMQGLVVEYEFEDTAGRDHRGTFLASAKDLQFYIAGRTHEIFYLESDPANNASSLVMRWYWRFGGPAMTDEAPEEDFPLDQDTVIEEQL